MKATILLVDDEPENLQIISDYLSEENPDYKVMQAKNGKIALKLAEKEKPDLLLTDWNMPGLTGLELTKLFKLRPEFKEIPVVMQTANTEDSQLKEAFENGVMDYIKKPISKLELLARVNSAIALSKSKRRTEELLLKIFPSEVAEELKERDEVTPKYFKDTSILFADIKGFSSTARRLKDTPEILVKKLDECFDNLDNLAAKYKVERIKTIGDCYMAVAGIPIETKDHAIRMVLMALAMQDYMESTNKNSQDNEPWQVRIGINSGDLVAGVIGNAKFAYDVWGDSVNLASRMESTGQVGKVHISSSTYELIKDYFDCEKRPELVNAKNIGEVQTYFVRGIKPNLSIDGKGLKPNEEFDRYRKEQFGI